MIPSEKNPLTPRETALRMLEHMPDDVSYEDIIRQLRILQDIENTLNDVEMGGFPAECAVEEARLELDDDASDHRPARSSVVLRSRAHAWESLAHCAGDARDTLLRGAVWHH